jgi:hypothetical protein
MGPRPIPRTLGGDVEEESAPHRGKKLLDIRFERIRGVIEEESAPYRGKKLLDIRFERIRGVIEEESTPYRGTNCLDVPAQRPGAVTCHGPRRPATAGGGQRRPTRTAEAGPAGPVVSADVESYAQHHRRAHHGRVL